MFTFCTVSLPLQLGTNITYSRNHILKIRDINYIPPLPPAIPEELLRHRRRSLHTTGRSEQWSVGEMTWTRKQLSTENIFLEFCSRLLLLVK